MAASSDDLVLGEDVAKVSSDDVSETAVDSALVDKLFNVAFGDSLNDLLNGDTIFPDDVDHLLQNPDAIHGLFDNAFGDSADAVLSAVTSDSDESVEALYNSPAIDAMFDSVYGDSLNSVLDDLSDISEDVLTLLDTVVEADDANDSKVSDAINSLIDSFDTEGVAEVLAANDTVEVVTPAHVDGLVKKAFDAYMVLEEDLELGQHRLLETDNKLYLPS